MAFNFFSSVGRAARQYLGIPDDPRQADPNVPAGLATAPGAAPDTVANQEIVVEKRRPGPPQPEDLVPLNLGNRDQILEAKQAMANGSDAADHRGMFKTKGTLRDILGVLGDAFLIQSGNKAMYAPQRDQEKASDALAGFTQQPQEAVERLAQVNPDAAAALWDKHQEIQAKQGQVKSMQDYRQSTVDQNKIENISRLRNYSARLMSSPQAQKNPELAMSQIANLARSTGVSLEDLGISPDMSPEERSMYGYGDMTVNQQMQLPYKDRAAAVAQQNADANTTRANRATPPRAAPNPTSASMAAPLVRKLQSGQKLTPAETETLDRLGYNIPKSGRGSGRSAPPPPPSGGRQFRVIR
jgi:hypothetical protein